VPLVVLALEPLPSRMLEVPYVPYESTRKITSKLGAGLVVEPTVVGMALVLATSEVGLLPRVESFCIMMGMRR